MNRAQLREAAFATPECLAYGVTGKKCEDAYKALHLAKQAFDLAKLADQRAETAYHSTPEFQALKNEWRNQ